jgi:hypothetical protein
VPAHRPPPRSRFTDIEEFTTIAERVAPDAMARVLGRSFEAMTAAVHARACLTFRENPQGQEASCRNRGGPGEARRGLVPY